MVYESRAGEMFLLGASSWRIEDITHDRVLVVARARDSRGRCPSGTATRRAGRSSWARALGRVRARAGERWRRGALARLRDGRPRRVGRRRTWCATWPSSARRPASCPTTGRSWSSASATRSATGASASTRPSARAVHAPWARAIEARLRQRLGIEVQAMYTDDGIVVRVPDADEAPPADAVFFDPEEVEELVTAEVGDSALFASRFREYAARALLLPRRRPGARTPLWQQRQRSAALLQVAEQIPVVPDHAGDVPRVPAGRLRPAGAGRAAGGGAAARGARRRGGHASCRRRSRARCCSGTSARSCTRATRRWPSAARRRCRSTARCSPS